MKHYTFFSLGGSTELATKVARAFRTRLAPVRIETFADGESYVCLQEKREHIDGQDVVIVASGAAHANDRLMELLLLLDALRSFRPKTVTVILSFYPYRRQERKVEGGEALGARVVARTLELSGVDEVIAVDLHTSKIRDFFSIPTHEVTTMPIFYHYFKKKIGRHPKEWVIIAPDHGITKACLYLAGTLGINFLQSYKHRSTHDVVVIDPLRGDVREKNVIILDDEIDTGRTMLANVRQIRRHGPSGIFLAATHGIFAGNALSRLVQDSLIREVIVTDTITHSRAQHSRKLRTISVAPLLVEALTRGV